jgi:hypothetical protein
MTPRRASISSDEPFFLNTRSGRKTKIPSIQPKQEGRPASALTCFTDEERSAESDKSAQIAFQKNSHRPDDRGAPMPVLNHHCHA